MEYEIDREIISMIASMTGFEPDEVTPEMSIVKDLGADSLKIIEIASAFNKKYKVVVEENQLTQMRTVGQSIALVKELLGKKQNS
ncbi:MAG: acyl carrier protein [Candidatus Omnitrophica bacterium]|nr:acyl carrier protein [Candidatus Omnitrophota bacterium]